MFKKKQKENTAPKVSPEAEGEQKIKKDIKVLWIYTTLFCLFALMLIAVSSIIQGKINSTAEYYQDLYEGEKTSSQSTIKNIKTENDSLKTAVDNYKKENELLKNQNETSIETINESARLIENCEYLLKAQKEAYTGKKSKAKELIKLVDPNVLTEETKEIYDKLCKTLGV